MFGELGGHAALHFFAGCVEIHLLTGGEAGDALLVGAGHDNQAVKALGGPGFEQQGGFHDCDTLRILQTDCVHPFVLASNNGRVDDAVQFLDTGDAVAFGLGIWSERDFRQFGAIYGSVRVQNFAAEVPNDFVVHGLARLHQRVGYAISFHQVSAQCDKHISHHRLAGSNSSGEANFHHRLSIRTIHCRAENTETDYRCDNTGTRVPRRIFAAFTVLNISIAMVSGPTPPGTGVTAPATAATLG